MKRYLGALLAALLSTVGSGLARAGDDGATAIVDRAIRALGGEEKLGKIVAFSWVANASTKANGVVTDQFYAVTFSGLDQVRRDIKSRSPYRVIVSGDKGWYTAGGKNHPMGPDDVVKQKRVIYLQVIPTLLVPVKGPGFKVQEAGEESVRGKIASILKITGPDGKDFTLSIDKESSLPVKEVSRSTGPDGKELVEETFFAAYKDFGGIKKATSIETRTDDQNYGYIDIVDFKVLDHVEPDRFLPPG